MLQRAVDAIRADDFTEACEWALKALEQDERNGFGWYLLAIARERAGDFASSVKAYEAALNLLPDQAEVANDLGRLAYRMGMHEQAEKLFRHFLARHPGPSRGRSTTWPAPSATRAASDEAIDIMRPAIIKHARRACCGTPWARSSSDEGDYANALTFFEEALRLDPKFAKARYNRGNARLALGDAEGALADCDAALNSALAAGRAPDDAVGPFHHPDGVGTDRRGLGRV